MAAPEGFLNTPQSEIEDLTMELAGLREST